MYDAVIIGAGTAGMTAGIYSARRGKSVLIIESGTYGGQIINSREIENYPAIKNVSGFEFASILYEQTLAQGVKIISERAVDIIDNKSYKTVVCEKSSYDCRIVIIASGAKNRPLGLENESSLIGRGISYCANCDGGFFKNKITAVVGGGNTAAEDAEILSEICSRVYLIHRRDEFRADKNTIEKLRSKDNVSFILNSNIIELLSDESKKLNAVVIKNNSTGKTEKIMLSGLFIAIGQVPNTEFVKNKIALDKNGYIIAGEDCATNIDGIYAAGDCRTKVLRQLTTAAADGAVCSAAFNNL